MTVETTSHVPGDHPWTPILLKGRACYTSRPVKRFVDNWDS